MDHMTPPAPDGEPTEPSAFSPEARLIHAGTSRTAGAPLAPTLMPASTYLSQGEPDPARGYGRAANPGWDAVEDALAAIEGPGTTAVSFPSGQAASMALMLALTRGVDPPTALSRGTSPGPPDPGARPIASDRTGRALTGGKQRIVFPDDGYYNTRALAARLRPHGAEAVAVDILDLDAVAGALSAGPAVLWAETPTNPLLRVADLARLGELAAAHGAPFVVDNTVATALLQRPLAFGAVASVYSLTKTLSGHSDVLGGAVVTASPELATALRDWRTSGGAIPGPFESWLILRGLKTLPLRLARQSANAQAIAEFLTGHPRVTAVHYPGLSSAPHLKAQMPHGHGCLLAFETLGTAADADAVVARARLIVPSTSFGGVESTWERRARWAAETAPPTLIRLSAGIEPAADLLADLDACL
jgi:cystathionine beta-lyase/cystathionine gamma-synthase